MVVIVLTSVPPKLRGHLTKWLLEISPGVYIGRLNAKVRHRLWKIVTDLAHTGRAIMIYTANGEQGLDFEVHNHHWEPVEVDGVHLIRRPTNPSTSIVRKGWSLAAQRRQHRRRAKLNEIPPYHQQTP